MIGDDGKPVTLADLHPGDLVVIEPDRGENVPWLVVQLGAHMGTYGKGKNKRARWHLVTTFDPESFERMSETWRSIDTVEIVAIVAYAPWMRELRQMNKKFRAVLHDQGAEVDPMTAKPADF